jgi:hypothetical protein
MVTLKSPNERLDNLTFYKNIKVSKMKTKTAQTTQVTMVFSFSSLIKEGYEIAKGVNNADNKLAQWVFNVVSTPLTEDERKLLSNDIKGWYSPAFSKQVNGAISGAYKLNVINNADKLQVLSLKTSFNDLYKQLREWKNELKTPSNGVKQTIKTKGANGSATVPLPDSEDGSILAQCAHAADHGFDDVQTTLKLFNKLLSDLKGELTPEQNAHIIQTLDELSDYVLRGE